MPLPSSGGEVTCCWWHLQVQRLQRFTFRFGILRCCISTVNGISSTWHHFWQFMIACTQLWCYYNKTFIHIISILVISKWRYAPPLYPFGMHYLLVLVIQWLHKWFFMIFHSFVWLCDAPTAWMATNKVCHILSYTYSPLFRGGYLYTGEKQVEDYAYCALKGLLWYTVILIGYFRLACCRLYNWRVEPMCCTTRLL